MCGDSVDEKKILLSSVAIASIFRYDEGWSDQRGDHRRA